MFKSIPKRLLKGEWNGLCPGRFSLYTNEYP